MEVGGDHVHGPLRYVYVTYVRATRIRTYVRTYTYIYVYVRTYIYRTHALLGACAYAPIISPQEENMYMRL